MRNGTLALVANSGTGALKSSVTSHTRRRQPTQLTRPIRRPFHPLHVWANDSRMREARAATRELNPAVERWLADDEV